MKIKRFAAVLAISATVVATASAAWAGPSPVGQWDFREGVPGVAVAPGSSFGWPALYVAGDRTDLSVVSVARGLALDVTSWRDLRPGQKVDRSASMLSTDPHFALAKPWGKDGGTSDFDPMSDDFRVSAWLLPTDASVFPRKTKSASGISLNVIQKGLNSTAGGFWKIELRMALDGEVYSWVPTCVMKGANYTTVVVNTGKQAIGLTPRAGSTVTCERSGDILTLTVQEDGKTPRTSSAGGAASLTIDNNAAVSVAHKPGTTDPRDAYDGLLTDLSIQRG